MTRAATPTEIGSTALSLAPIVVAARGVAFLVPVVIAHLFGATGVTDAFFYALALPAFLMVVVANALGTAMTPAMASAWAADPRSLGPLTGAAALATALVTALVGFALLLALGPLLPRVTRFDAAAQGLTLRFVAALLPFLALTGVNIALRAACEIRGRFLPVALAPMLRGGAALTALFALHTRLGPVVLPAALALGALVETGWLTAVLLRAGVVPVPGSRLPPILRGAGLFALPVVAGEVLVASNVLVDKAFAALLPAGSVSLLEYADRARLIPQTFLESTLLSVAFATWAHQAARGERRALARELDQSLRWVAALSAPPLAGLYIARYTLTAALYQRGAFSVADAEGAAQVFGWYVPGLWSMMLGATAMRAHVVERRGALVLRMGALSVLLNAMLNAALAGPMGVSGLALASTIVWIVVPAGYLLALRPTLAPAARLSRWLPVLLVAGASAGAAAVVELGPGAPRTLLDPVLWISAGACLALLGAAVRASRP